MSTSTPETKKFLEDNDLCEHTLQAQYMRMLEKRNNVLKVAVACMKEDMKTMGAELRPAAFNRRFMQIARPARTCLNIIKKHIK